MREEERVVPRAVHGDACERDCRHVAQPAVGYGEGCGCAVPRVPDAEEVVEHAHDSQDDVPVGVLCGDLVERDDHAYEVLHDPEVEAYGARALVRVLRLGWGCAQPVERVHEEAEAEGECEDSPWGCDGGDGDGVCDAGGCPEGHVPRAEVLWGFGSVLVGFRYEAGLCALCGHGREEGGEEGGGHAREREVDRGAVLVALAGEGLVDQGGGVGVECGLYWRVHEEDEGGGYELHCAHEEGAAGGVAALEHGLWVVSVSGRVEAEVLKSWYIGECVFWPHVHAACPGRSGRGWAV